MTVRELMTAQPVTCASGTSLAAAGALLLEADSGFLPVVDDNLLTGVVTDRDMFIALATRNRRASEVAVGEVARRQVRACASDADVEDALALMKTHRIRRLPVIDGRGGVEGVISLNDILLALHPGADLSRSQLVSTLQAIGAHGHQQLQPVED